MNKVIIIGHLGRDPESRFARDGKQVATLNIATTRKWRDAQNNLREETEWHRVSCWEKLAQFAVSYCPKGREVAVEGRLRTTSYDKDGQKHYTTEIVAETLKGLGPGPAARQAGARPRSAAGPVANDDGFDDGSGAQDFGGGPADDDIPF